MPVPLVPKAQQGRQVRKDHRESKDLKVQQVLRGLQVKLVHRGLKVSKGFKVLLGRA